MKSFVLYLLFLLLPIITCWAQSKEVSLALEKMSYGYIIESFRDFEKNAKRNDILAQFFLAQCYEKGYGTMINKEKAFRYYRKAAERGLAVGQMALANCYRIGIGVTPNNEKVEYWEGKARGKYNPKHLNLLEICYIEGSKHQKNYYQTSNNITSTHSLASQPTAPIAQVSTPTSNSIMVSTPDEVATTTPRSDVDNGIPVITSKNKECFAVIISNEDYVRECKVPYSLNDGEVFANYCEKTLGLPAQNIHLVKNATLNDMKFHLNWLKQVMEAYNGEAKAIIYYAGHGIPDESKRTAFLLPVDGYATDITTGYSLQTLYETLGKIPSKLVTIFLDACFSGAKREGDMLVAARGITVKVKEGSPLGNMVVFSAAQGDETAYPYKEQQHGMFTYYLLKKLQETQGEATLGELKEYVVDQVRKRSIVVNGKMQTPTIIASPMIGEGWLEHKLK
ncbi:MAG: caspase family protein [Bacteroides sp.]|nr:caspase family protein [Bacteroides sp.]